MLKVYKNTSFGKLSVFNKIIMAKEQVNDKQNLLHKEFKQWLKLHGLESVTDQLINAGFETKQDLNKLSEKDLNILCNKFNIDKVRLKIALSFLFMESILIITTEEIDVLTNLEKSIEIADSSVKKFKMYKKGVHDILYFILIKRQTYQH